MFLKIAKDGGLSLILINQKLSTKINFQTEDYNSFLMKSGITVLLFMNLPFKIAKVCTVVNCHKFKVEY